MHHLLDHQIHDDYVVPDIIHHTHLSLWLADYLDSPPQTHHTVSLVLAV